jgi:hypothetical protein
MKLLAFRELPDGTHLELWQASADTVSLVARRRPPNPVCIAEITVADAELVASTLPEPRNPNLARPSRKRSPALKTTQAVQALAERLQGNAAAALDLISREAPR